MAEQPLDAVAGRYYRIVSVKNHYTGKINEPFTRSGQPAGVRDRSLTLPLQTARAISAAAAAHGQRSDAAPLCIAIVDRGGHLLLLERDDRAAIYRVDIAIAKARGCIGMGMGGRALALRARTMPALYDAFNAVTNGIVPVPGGLLIRDAQGDILGAIGISGDTADNDELCAVAGVEGAGLIADTGASS